MTDNFDTLGLRPELVRTVAELGYEQPTPIQAGAIPVLLAGRDVLGQAQTGTGKTAAFTLPMLEILDPVKTGVQSLILAPTRELAIQVAEAVYRYGHQLGVRVLPIYGGQSITRQMKRLERDTQVVVGTPGRMLDLIRRNVLDLSHVRYLVLDEADEMLKMGFIEDVEAILSATPTTRQTALFSATLSTEIRRLAQNYMHDPVPVLIAGESMTVPQMEQRYYLVDEKSKFTALTRLLEVENLNSTLIFTRTRAGAAELAESLVARGYPAEAIHGDLSQDARETVMRRFRKGQLTVLVATDMVARGVDMEGVSHVINFDIPFDPEDYVHRIGRTGRAGRSGIAITLLTPGQTRRLKMIEAFTKHNIHRATLPTVEAVYASRESRFQTHLDVTLSENLEDEVRFVQQLIESGYDPVDMAAAAIHMARTVEQQRPVEEIVDVREKRSSDRAPRMRDRERGQSDGGGRRKPEFEPGMVRLLLNLGREHGIRPGDVVGAIASEARIPGNAIGAIDIGKHETFVDVKEKHVENVLRSMKQGKLRGKMMTLTRAVNN